MAEYPEHDKLKALGGANQTVGDFIEWLGEQGIELASYGNGAYRDVLFPLRRSRDTLIAQFFEIDTNKLEAEKRAMLDEIRESQA